MKKYSIKLPKYSRANSQEEIPILTRLERQHTLLNTAVDPANPEWHEMTLRTRKSMESFSGSESRSSSSTNSVVSSSERSMSSNNTHEATGIQSASNSNLPVPTGAAMVITDTDLASSWLYKRRKGMFESEHEGGTCNEAFETSLTDSVDSPPPIPAPPPPPPPTPNQVSPSSDFKQQFIMPSALLLPKAQMFREEDSPESFQDVQLKPIPIAKKRRSKSTCCCYLTVLLIAFVCMFGLLSTIGGIVYLEVFTSEKPTGQLKNMRSNVAGSMLKDYGISDKSPKRAESQHELVIQPEYVPSSESSNDRDDTSPTSANEKYNLYRSNVGDSSDDNSTDDDINNSVPGSSAETKTTQLESSSVKLNIELDETEKGIIRRTGERFESDPMTDEPNTDNLAEQSQQGQSEQSYQESNECDDNIAEKSGMRAPCRIILQVSDDVVPAVSMNAPLEGSRPRQKLNTTAISNSSKPLLSRDLVDSSIDKSVDHVDRSEDDESQNEMNGTAALLFVHSTIETKPMASIISEASTKNTQPTPVIRDIVASEVHQPTPTSSVDQSVHPVFRTTLPDDNLNNVEKSSVISHINDAAKEFAGAEDKEMFPEYAISESDQETNTKGDGRSRDQAPMEAISGINIPAPPIRIPQSSADVFPSGFDKIIDMLKQTNSRQSLINQRQMMPVSESGFSKRKLIPTEADLEQDIFDIQRPKHGRLQESIAAVLKRFQTLENNNLPGSRAAAHQRSQPRTPRVPSGADEVEKKLYLDKIRVMLYDN